MFGMPVVRTTFSISGMPNHFDLRFSRPSSFAFWSVQVAVQFPGWPTMWALSRLRTISPFQVCRRQISDVWHAGTR